MKQSRVQKRREAGQNRPTRSPEDQDGPDVHEEARTARRRAHRASERAERFLEETEKG